MDDFAVEWTLDTLDSSGQGMSVDHRRRDAVMAHQFLDGTDVAGGLEQVGGEGVSQGVTSGPFGDARAHEGEGESALDRGFVDVMASAGTFRENVHAGSREHPLPGPIGGGRGLFVFDAVGKEDRSSTRKGFEFVVLFESCDMRRQQTDEAGGQHGSSILPSLALADQDFSAVEVDVLNSELQALKQAQAGAVHQRGGEIGQASQVLKDEGDFGAGEDHGNADSAFGADEVGKVRDITADDVSVQEEKRTEGLVLRGGSDPS